MYEESNPVATALSNFVAKQRTYTSL
jgi:hypothetical protein